MKNSKKLLILVLSLMLLVGVFATVAFAESADKVTVSYPDGTQVQYAVGETIVSPVGGTYAGKDNTLYKNAGAGWTYSLDGTPLSGLVVTEAMLGKTVVASGYDKVYFTVEVTGGDTIYYTNADTAGKDLKAYITNMNAAGSTTVLYADITSEGMAVIGKKESVYRLDLNGHTWKLTSNAGGGAFDVRQNEFFLYSSKEGGVLDTSAVSHMFRTNDGKYNDIRIDGDLHIGEYDDTRTDYGKNLTVYAQCLNSDMYGSSAYFNGGTYVQTTNSTADYFLMIGRKATNESHVQRIRNCTFVLNKATSGFVWHFTSAARTYQNCNFINAAGGMANIFANETMNAVNTITNCKFYNTNPAYAHGGKEIKYSGETRVTFTGAIPERPAGEVLAHVQPTTVVADGEYYQFSSKFVTDVSSALAVNWGGRYTDYWTVGTTPACNIAALNYIIEHADGTATFYSHPSIDYSILCPVTEDVLGTTLDVEVIFESIEPVAFTWTTNGVLSVQQINGMTDVGIGMSFYDMFKELPYAADIKVYADFVLYDAMAWGPSYTNDNNVIEYKSLIGGNVTLDLNGHVLSIPALEQGINVSNSNSTGSYPHSSTAVFGFEQGSQNTFTLKSSRPDAKILNASSLALFAVGESDCVHIVIDGENITYVGKGAVTHAFEVGSTPTLTVNGGTYVIESNRPAFSFQSVTTIKDAQILLLGDAPLSVFATTNWKRNASFSVENTIIYSKNKVKLFAITGAAYGEATPADAAKTYSLTLTDCTFSGVDFAKNEHLDTFEISGITKADSEAALLAAYGTKPAGTNLAKYIIDLYGETLTFFGYGKTEEVVTVNYGTLYPTEYYLLGSFFTPVAAEDLKDTYYKLNAGIFVDIEGYKSDMASLVVAEKMIGRTYDAAAYINYVEKPLAFVVLSGELAVAHGLLASENAGADLVAAVKAAAEGAVIRLYADVACADAIENTAAVTLDLGGMTLTVNAAFAQTAALTVKNGSLILAADVDALFGGVVAIEDAAIYNVAAEADLTAATATVKNSKVYNLLLADKATLSGTVFYTDANASSFADGVEGNVGYNNNLELLTVGDAVHEIEFSRAATDDASKVFVATFTYKGEVKGTVSYYEGSFPNFYSSATPGYYFSYTATEEIYEDSEFVCLLVADSAMLKAQFVITDALNVVFYLQKQEGLSSVRLNGVEQDLSSLAIETIENAEYYVIPVVFDTFADSLKVVTFAVDVDFGETVETVSAEISLLDYAEQILDGEIYTDKDKSLVYALLAYVDSIVDYFKYDVESEIKSVLAENAEYETAYVAPEGEKITSDYVKGILYIVDEKVDLALRIDPDFAGTVKVNGVAYTAENITLVDGNSYIILEDLAFSEITLDYVVEILVAEEVVETFTYSFATYTDAMTVQNMGYVPSYVKTLYIFATLAAAY